MKQKKNDLVDRAEIVDNPSAKYQEIKQMNEEVGKLQEIDKIIGTNFDRIESELIAETSHDKEIFRGDTVMCIKRYLERLIKDFSIFKDMNPVLREKLYHRIHKL